MKLLYEYHTGYDYFTPDPGKWKTKHCEACGTYCDVKRSHVGKRTRYGRSDSVFDVFNCPNADEHWHTEVIKILEVMRDMPSQRIVDIMKKDVDDILRANITDTHALLWMEVENAH